MLGAQPALGIQSGVIVSWPASTANTYQVRWSPNPEAGPWANLGGAVIGGPRIVDEAIRGRMREILAEIRAGRFSQMLEEEEASGYPRLRQARD